ncbi:MAG: Rab family GTPase [Candidatus Hodarchaeales archaeon]|jgi:hypothetical protein
MSKPDNITRISYFGEVPRIMNNIFLSRSEKKLSGDFFKYTGFNTRIKTFIIDGENVNVQFWDRGTKGIPGFAHAKIYFFNLNNKSGWDRISEIFELEENRDPYTQTVIGLMENTSVISEADRLNIQNNDNLNYKEIQFTDKYNLELILKEVLENCYNRQFILKIAFVGSEEKTELIRRFAEGKFDVNYLPTLGVDITTKRMYVQGLTINLVMTDTESKESFGSLRPSFYRGAVGGIIFYTDNSRISYERVPNWVAEISKYIPIARLPIFIIGLTTSESVVSIEDGQLLTERYGGFFFQCGVNDSAKLHNIMVELITQIFRYPR